MYKITFIFLLILFKHTCSFAQIQNVKYKVIYKDKEVGTLIATKQTSDSIIFYQNKTKIDTRIITKVSLEYDYKITFEKGLLNESIVQIELNGKSRKNSKTVLEKNKYHYYEDEKLSHLISENINYTAAMLMLEEPIDIQNVYSEENGTFHSLKKIEEHIYEKKGEKNRINTYIYKNNILKKAIIDAGIIEFQVELIDN